MRTRGVAGFGGELLLLLAVPALFIGEAGAATKQQDCYCTGRRDCISRNGSPYSNCDPEGRQVICCVLNIDDPVEDNRSGLQDNANDTPDRERNEPSPPGGPEDSRNDPDLRPDADTHFRFSSGSPKDIEDIRFQSSTTARPFETSRQSFEPSRQTFEPSRPTFEPSRQTFEPSRPTFEPSRPTFEPSRQTFEPSRQTFEPSRQTFEPTRQTFEPSRQPFQPSEDSRFGAESTTAQPSRNDEDNRFSPAHTTGRPFDTTRSGGETVGRAFETTRQPFRISEDSADTRFKSGPTTARSFDTTRQPFRHDDRDVGTTAPPFEQTTPRNVFGVGSEGGRFSNEVNPNTITVSPFSPRPGSDDGRPFSQGTSTLSPANQFPVSTRSPVKPSAKRVPWERSKYSGEVFVTPVPVSSTPSYRPRPEVRKSLRQQVYEDEDEEEDEEEEDINPQEIEWDDGAPHVNWSQEDFDPQRTRSHPRQQQQQQPRPSVRQQSQQTVQPQQRQPKKLGWDDPRKQQQLAVPWSSWKDCGHKGADADQDGSAEPGEWPWHAALLEASSDRYVCGATVLGPTWLLTAAHCVLDYTDPGSPALKVRVGELDVRSDTESFTQERAVAELVPHPGFDLRSLRHDVALVRIARPPRDQRNVAAVCLPPPARQARSQEDSDEEDDIVEDDSFPREGTMCVVTGWGRKDEESAHSEVLKEILVPVWGRKSCQDALRTPLGTAFRLPGSAVCAGARGRDACDGDGGGPLVCQSGGRWYQAGIVSYGIGCGRTNSPGVYSRVSRYTSWIRSVTGALRSIEGVPSPTAAPPAPAKLSSTRPSAQSVSRVRINLGQPTATPSRAPQRNVIVVDGPSKNTILDDSTNNNAFTKQPFTTQRDFEDAEVIRTSPRPVVLVVQEKPASERAGRVIGRWFSPNNSSTSQSNKGSAATAARPGAHNAGSSYFRSSFGSSEWSYPVEAPRQNATTTAKLPDTNKWYSPVYSGSYRGGAATAGRIPGQILSNVAGKTNDGLNRWYSPFYSGSYRGNFNVKNVKDDAVTPTPENLPATTPTSNRFPSTTVNPSSTTSRGSYRTGNDRPPLAPNRWYAQGSNGGTVVNGDSRWYSSFQNGTSRSGLINTGARHRFANSMAEGGRQAPVRPKDSAVPVQAQDSKDGTKEDPDLTWTYLVRTGAYGTVITLNKANATMSSGEISDAESSGSDVSSDQLDERDSVVNTTTAVNGEGMFSYPAVVSGDPGVTDNGTDAESAGDPRHPDNVSTEHHQDEHTMAPGERGGSSRLPAGELRTGRTIVNISNTFTYPSAPKPGSHGPRSNSSTPTGSSSNISSSYSIYRIYPSVINPEYSGTRSRAREARNFDTARDEAVSFNANAIRGDEATSGKTRKDPFIGGQVRNATTKAPGSADRANIVGYSHFSSGDTAVHFNITHEKPMNRTKAFSQLLTVSESTPAWKTFPETEPSPGLTTSMNSDVTTIRTVTTTDSTTGGLGMEEPPLLPASVTTGEASPVTTETADDLVSTTEGLVMSTPLGVGIIQDGIGSTDNVAVIESTTLHGAIRDQMSSIGVPLLDTEARAQRGRSRSEVTRTPAPRRRTDAPGVSSLARRGGRMESRSRAEDEGEAIFSPRRRRPDEGSERSWGERGRKESNVARSRISGNRSTGRKQEEATERRPSSRGTPKEWEDAGDPSGRQRSRGARTRSGRTRSEWEAPQVPPVAQGAQAPPSQLDLGTAPGQRQGPRRAPAFHPGPHGSKILPPGMIKDGSHDGEEVLEAEARSTRPRAPPPSATGRRDSDFGRQDIDGRRGRTRESEFRRRGNSGLVNIMPPTTTTSSSTVVQPILDDEPEVVIQPSLEPDRWNRLAPASRSNRPQVIPDTIYSEPLVTEAQEPFDERTFEDPTVVVNLRTNGNRKKSRKLKKINPSSGEVQSVQETTYPGVPAGGRQWGSHIPGAHHLQDAVGDARDEDDLERDDIYTFLSQRSRRRRVKVNVRVDPAADDGEEAVTGPPAPAPHPPSSRRGGRKSA